MGCLGTLYFVPLLKIVNKELCYLLLTLIDKIIPEMMKNSETLFAIMYTRNKTLAFLTRKLQSEIQAYTPVPT